MPKLNSSWARRVNETVKPKIPQIIDAFVAFYGEEYREKISQRLNNTIFVFTDVSTTESDDINSTANIKYRQSVLDLLIEEDIVDAEEIYLDMCADGAYGGASGSAYVGFRFSNITQPAAICFLPKLTKINDSILFHELNHIVLSDLNLDGKFLNRRMGLSILKYYIDIENQIAIFDDTVFGDEKEEQLSLFDEVINDYLSIKILKAAQSEGFKFGTTEILSSAYSAAFTPLESFFEKYLKEIKEAVLNGNKAALTNLFTKDDFDDLLENIDALITIDNKEFEFLQGWFEENNFDLEKLMKQFDGSSLSYPAVVEEYVFAAKAVEKLAAKARRTKHKSHTKTKVEKKSNKSGAVFENDDQSLL